MAASVHVLWNLHEIPQPVSSVTLIFYIKPKGKYAFYLKLCTFYEKN
jgi:hypothetical protein